MALGMDRVLPWQQEPWRQLMARKAAGRFPHALLIGGPAGIGKRAFAAALAGALLCEESAGAACGRCPGCLQFAGGAHPDYGLWEPEEDAVALKIHQIREMNQTIFLTRSRGPYKVCVVNPADAMTPAAADSLLKTLEEPPPLTVLLLVSHRASQLSATIRSRCQAVRLAPCYGEPASGWLQAQGLDEAAATNLLGITGGTPLRALALAGEGALEEGGRVAAEVRDLAHGRADPVTVAQRWSKIGLEVVLPWLQGLIQDAIRGACDPSGASLRHVVTDESPAHLSLGHELALLFAIDARLNRLAEALAQRHSLSHNSLAEQIAIPLYQAGGRGK
ncbi:MAG: DNA polymerase III subunit delta' [Gammaproteobacteria bacterium]|nr:DNA polymerase III subunit delta' [Gammaproteobacteria bacterium]